MPNGKHFLLSIQVEAVFKFFMLLVAVVW